MNNNTVFISDLHLNPTESKITNLFLKFLENIASQTDALYILGDLFKFWAGDDDNSSFNEQIKQALKITSAKIPVYLMPGNRDFILGQIFAKETGCILLTDPCKIDLYNRPTMLTHGDILSHDIKHRAFRVIIRFPHGVKLFLKLPLKMRIRIASAIQKWSARNKLTTDNKEFQPQANAIKNLTTRFNVVQLIHGHTHNIATEEFNIGAQQMRRISLGEWSSDCGSILIYQQDGQFEFKKFT
jgi:UDP-2,3-diacylglucosamine hydrolase